MDSRSLLLLNRSISRSLLTFMRTSSSTVRQGLGFRIEGLGRSLLAHTRSLLAHTRPTQVL